MLYLKNLMISGPVIFLIFLLFLLLLLGSRLVTAKPALQRVTVIARSIPKLIHITWKDRNALRNMGYTTVRYGVGALRRLNPEYTLYVYEDQEVEAQLRGNLQPSDWELLQTQRFVTKCDIWRLLVMVQTGGIYSDIDRVWSEPFRDIVDPEVECILPIYNNWDFAQDVMISCQGHAVHRRALQLGLERLREGRSVLSIGPHAYFDSVAGELLGEGAVPPHNGRTPSNHTWNLLLEAIAARPEIQTFKEDHTHGPTFGHRRGPIPIMDKEEFYAASKVVPWLNT